MNPRVPIDQPRLDDFCRRWKVQELSLFGSVLRDDFRPESDVDVLISFLPGAGWSLLDFVEMEEELEQMLGRKVDLIEKAGLKNPFRRHSILTTRHVLYAA